MSTEQVSIILSRIHFFSSFDSTTLERLAEAAFQQKYKNGQHVFLEGDPCIGLYIVKSGWLRAVKRSPTGREQVFRFVGPGDVFNEISVLTGDVNLITVEVLEPTELIIIQRSKILGLIEKDPEIAGFIIQNLAQRVLHAMNLIVDLSLHSIETRLARYLLENATGDYVYRKSWSTQAAIAARIGTVPVVINRAFRAFVEQNLIDFDRNRILLLNRTELESIALRDKQ